MEILQLCDEVLSIIVFLLSYLQRKPKNDWRRRLQVEKLTCLQTSRTYASFQSRLQLDKMALYEVNIKEK